MRADAKRNHEILLDTAKALLGASTTFVTNEQIARQAKVGIGTLYRHFPTRKALLETVFAQQLERFVRQAESLYLQMSPDQALEEWLEKVIAYGSRYRAFAELIVLMTTDKSSPLYMMTARMLKTGQAQGLLRSDVSVQDIMRLMASILNFDAPNQVASHNSKLLHIFLRGLVRSRD